MKIGVILSGIISFIGCLIVLIFALIYIKDIIQYKKNGIKVDGEVVLIFMKSISEGGQVVVYKIEFSTLDNQCIEITNQFFAKDSRYRVGDKVSILYMENNPEDAKIDTGKEMIFPIILLIVFATILFIIGLCMLYYQKQIEEIIVKYRA